MKNDSPLVSVLMPAYNSEKYIAHSIRSILNQTFTDFELCIINDGSTDNTSDICKELTKGDKRIRYFYEKNSGQGVARNLGIKNSLGEFVLLLDSDDYILPNMIKDFIILIQSNNYDYISCKRWVFNTKKGLISINPANPSCIIYKKKLFDILGYFDESEEMRGIEDTDLDFKWKSKLKIKNIKYKSLEIPLVIYLEHDNQETSHIDIKKLNKRTDSIIEKYIDNKDIPKNELSLKYKESGNFNLLVGNIKTGRRKLFESLKYKFNYQAFILLLTSFLGSKIYNKFVYFIKIIREKTLYKFNLIKNVKKYPEIYKQVLNITSTYKNW